MDELTRAKEAYERALEDFYASGRAKKYARRLDRAWDRRCEARKAAGRPIRSQP